MVFANHAEQQKKFEPWMLLTIPFPHVDAIINFDVHSLTASKGSAEIWDISRNVAN